MDHNGDGTIDLTDFLMWEERMEDGKANTDFWALQEVSFTFRQTVELTTSIHSSIVDRIPTEVPNALNFALTKSHGGGTGVQLGRRRLRTWLLHKCFRATRRHWHFVAPIKSPHDTIFK